MNNPENKKSFIQLLSADKLKKVLQRNEEVMYNFIKSNFKNLETDAILNHPHRTTIYLDLTLTEFEKLSKEMQEKIRTINAEEARIIRKINDENLFEIEKPYYNIFLEPAAK